MKISGYLNKWKIFNQEERLFINVVIPYGEARYIFKSRPYNAFTGKGEQRVIIDSHVRKISSEMLSGNYTPTPISANVEKEEYKIDGDLVTISLSKNQSLAQTDGQQRFGAIEKILESAEEKNNEELKKSILELPISATIYLNGTPQQDFINLQKGRPVDKATIFSMQEKLNRKNGDKVLSFAVKIGKFFYSDNFSVFYRHIKFDSRTQSGFPFSSLCLKSSGDLSTSFYGLAKVAHDKFDEKQVSSIMNKITDKLKTNQELSSANNVLSIPPSATIGSVRMLVGLNICVLHRMNLLNRKECNQSDIDLMYKICKDIFINSNEMPNNLANKKKLISKFCSEYFDGMNIEFSDKIPKSLTDILSTQSYGE